jgi:DNA-binding winged helix-turn-helix (wHTH) protein
VLVEVRPPTRHDPRCAVDVVAADRPGLLARVASVLADTGLDVNHAIVATWPDGAALESFLVDATAVPSAADLSEAIARAAAAPLTTDALSGAVVDFDDVTSPWYTRVRVDTDDRPRRLIAIAGALAAAGIDVHSADIRGEGGIASDVFEVTGSEGGKLRAGERVAVVDLLRSGAVLSPPRSRLHRAWDRLRATWVSGDGQEEEIRETDQCHNVLVRICRGGDAMTQIVGVLDSEKPLAKALSVTVLDWPEQAGEAEALACAGHLRLLLVAPGVAPPVDWDLTSDWLRRPSEPQDIYARIETIQRRARPERIIRVDEDGLLWRGFDWVPLAPAEIPLLHCLLQNMHRLVSHDELYAAAWADGGSTNHRGLDTRVQRLRNRVGNLGLDIVNVRGRGFVLTARNV